MDIPSSRDSGLQSPLGALGGGLSCALKVRKPADAVLNTAAGEGVAPPPYDPLAFRAARGAAGGRGETAPARAVERERTRQIARIGNNLNQLARWANTHASAAEAVSVIAHLVSFERSLLRVARIGEDGGDAP